MYLSLSVLPSSLSLSLCFQHASFSVARYMCFPFPAKSVSTGGRRPKNQQKPLVFQCFLLFFRFWFRAVPRSGQDEPREAQGAVLAILGCHLRSPRVFFRVSLRVSLGEAN